jgi:hypothetical protein
VLGWGASFLVTTNMKVHERTLILHSTKFQYLDDHEIRFLFFNLNIQFEDAMASDILVSSWHNCFSLIFFVCPRICIIGLRLVSTLIVYDTEELELNMQAKTRGGSRGFLAK